MVDVTPMRPTVHLAVALVVALVVAWSGCGGDEPADADAAVAEVRPPGDAAPLFDAAATPDAPVGSDAPDPVDTAAPHDAAAPDTATADTATADTTIATDTADTAITADTSDTSDTGDTADTASVDTADVSPADAADTAPDPSCPSLPPGYARHVVLSRPYATPSSTWEVRPLAADGALGAPGGTFLLGRAREGVVAFSPDGRLGFAALDDGTLGVFTLDATGAPTVIAAGLDPGAYITGVVIDGDRLLLVDPNWPNNGGGIYAAAWDCHGAVGPATRLYSTKNAVAVVVKGADHLVAAREAGDATVGHVHLLRPGASGYSRVGGADVFSDDDAILSAFALMGDGRYALVGDYSAFSGVPNRVGIAGISASGVTAVGVLSPLDDPVAIVASPWGDAAIVVSGYSNAVRVLGYAPDSNPVFTDLGEPAWVESRPALPSSAALIGPSHPGVVLIVENVAVRRLRFDGGGHVTDLGRTAAGAGVAAIPGAIGVQP